MKCTAMLPADLSLLFLSVRYGTLDSYGALAERGFEVLNCLFKATLDSNPNTNYVLKGSDDLACRNVWEITQYLPSTD